VDQADQGVGQYVILGAGLDTFAQRRAEVASRLQVFEVDQPGPQAWKRRRLHELGYGVPEWLRLAPVDFEAGGSWWDRVSEAGFVEERPAVVASTGVALYLGKDTVAATLRQIAALAPGTTLAMSFNLPLDLVAPEDRPGVEMAMRGAQASGTPFVSFFAPGEMLDMALDAGFTKADHVSSDDLARRYFADRTDGLRPSTGEDILVATN
jgi:methyltransferase (TIGR00027 family)